MLSHDVAMVHLPLLEHLVHREGEGRESPEESFREATVHDGPPRVVPRFAMVGGPPFVDPAAGPDDAHQTGCANQGVQLVVGRPLFGPTAGTRQQVHELLCQGASDPDLFGLLVDPI